MARPIATNRGRFINYVNGITGIATGASAIVNLPVNQRYHRLWFQCAAVNYTGGTSLSIVKITGAGTAATITPTIVNGQVTGGTITAGGSGWTVGDTFTFTDSTGLGFIGTVATVTGGPPGALATFTVTSGGSPSPINPGTMIIGIKLSVNGVNMRDITPAQMIAISTYNGYLPEIGELPIFFTEPWRNVNQHNEVTSWDTFGQSTFSIQFIISPFVVNPQLLGVQEFDYFRNTQPVKNARGVAVEIPFLQPIAQHSFSVPIPAGVFSLNTLPFDYPIARMFISGSTPGAILQLEILQDANKVLETQTNQNQQGYRQYDFGASTIYNNRSIPNILNAQSPFDVAYLSDPDQRYWKWLKCANSLVIRVTSSAAQTLTVIQESAPGAYAS